MRSKFNNHLAIIIALYTVITATLLGFLIGSFQIWSNFQDRNQHIQDSVQTTISTTLPSLSLATYNFNALLIQQLIDSLAAHPDIINASILNTKGSELAIAAINKTCTPSNLDIFLYGSNNQYEYPLVHQQTLIGKLIIEVNYCKQTDNFFVEVKTTLISNFILSISIALFIYIIFYHFVSQPISYLVRRLQEVDPAAIDYSSLQHLSSARKDEIGSLTNHFSNLLRTTHDQISRLKSAEHTINNYSTNLEYLVAKRTKALTGINRQLKAVNQELALSQKLSERFNQSQFRLLRNLTDEFCVPLTTTIQALSSLQNDCKTTEDRLSLQCSINQNKTILSLLSELDSIAKLKSDLHKLNISPFSFKRIFSKIEATFKQKDCPCTFFIRFDNTVSSSHMGDIQKIEPLLFNLIANIYHCSSEKRINIDISETNKHLLIKLSAPNLIINEHLFEQVILPISNTLSLSSSRLTGLGLAFAEDLIEILEGEIHQSSNSQNEHELSVQLPLLSSDEQLDRIRQQLPSGGLRIHLSQPLKTNRIIAILDEWQLPFNTSYQSGNEPVILITDIETDSQDAVFIIGLGQQYEHTEELKGIKVVSLKTMKEGLLFKTLTQACSQLEQDKTCTQGVRILLVEDNAINRMLCQRFIKNLNINIEIEIVVNGREALTICSQRKFDLIFMDCQMPVMDGFQATREIRQSPLNQTTPIIALTGLDSDNERQACLKAGMNDFITKPFTQEQLNNAIIQWLPNEDQAQG
jgi:CheY-like chemotaxis protein/signal transduction histidine kinase/type III secretory pathway component EscS